MAISEFEKREARGARTQSLYREVNERPNLFVVLPGHEDRGVERVVSTNERFLIVEKTGKAGRQAEATDPRS
jgi:hypothetical protein